EPIRFAPGATNHCRSAFRPFGRGKHRVMMIGYSSQDASLATSANPLLARGGYAHPGCGQNLQYRLSPWNQKLLAATFQLDGLAANVLRDFRREVFNMDVA